MTENGILGIEYGELNLGRLPTYHRFDVNIKRTFFFTEKVTCSSILVLLTFMTVQTSSTLTE